VDQPDYDFSDVEAPYPQGAGIVEQAQIDQDEEANPLMARLANSLERIATALERANARPPVQQPRPQQQSYPQPNQQPYLPQNQQQYQQRPQVAPQQQQFQQGPPISTEGWLCPIHGQAKIVPSGYSARLGRNYTAFVACPVQDCGHKKPRDWQPVQQQGPGF